MSRVTEKSPKHCAAKQQALNNSRHTLKLLLLSLSSLLLILLSFFLILFLLLLRPSHPQFSISRADFTPTNSTALHLLIQSHNPNTRVGIYYDHISVGATFAGRKVTGEIPIAPFYQDHGETDILSASLVVNDRRGDGKMGLSLEVVGELRWGFWNWKSGKRRFSVSCEDMVVAFAGGGAVYVVLPPSQCSTTL